MLSVDPASAVPPFEQLRRQFVQSIRSGELAPGAKLPTVRRLAADLGLAANTVARAYRELETAGVIVTRGRNGTFVALSDDVAERTAQEAAAAYVARVRALGLTDDDALAHIRAAFGA